MRRAGFADEVVEVVVLGPLRLRCDFVEHEPRFGQSSLCRGAQADGQRHAQQRHIDHHDDQHLKRRGPQRDDAQHGQYRAQYAGQSEAGNAHLHHEQRVAQYERRQRDGMRKDQIEQDNSSFLLFPVYHRRGRAEKQVCIKAAFFRPKCHGKAFICEFQQIVLEAPGKILYSIRSIAM